MLGRGGVLDDRLAGPWASADGQTGPRRRATRDARRATREELLAFVEREQVRIAREHPDW
jgi:hypothetical protein